jgi:hypothetical protein
MLAAQGSVGPQQEGTHAKLQQAARTDAAWLERPKPMSALGIRKEVSGGNLSLAAASRRAMTRTASGCDRREPVFQSKPMVQPLPSPFEY